MRQTWLTAALVLAMGYVAGPVRADELAEPELDGAPAEPVYTVVPRGRFADPDAGPPVRPYQFTLASGIYLFQPTFQSDPALVVTHGGAAQQLDFSRHMVAAPAVWLGVTNDRGWGVRMRWFTFDQNTALVAASGPGDLLSAASPVPAAQTPVAGLALATTEMHLDSWEGEVTCQLERSCWCFLLGGGVRYVHLDQNYSSTITDNNGGRTVALANHDFNGVGPTFTFQGQRPIGCGFSGYGLLRSSVLFGSGTVDYSGMNAAGQTGEITRHAVNVLPIGELEAGIEYSHPWHHARLFLQSGFVGQVWWGGGNGSNVDGVNTTATANSNFGFVGLAVRAGVGF